MTFSPRLCFLTALIIFQSAQAEAEPPVIEVKGMLIKECSLPGETRKDDVVPRHANAIQIASDRWCILYSTHGYRGVDDERSIVYQIREASPDGKVLKEGFLALTTNDWKPEGVPPAAEGKSYVKQHGHMTAFGVPAGAVVADKLPEHGNLFVATWRVVGVPLIVAEKKLERAASDPVLFAKTKAVEWCQFRLNRERNDIDIVQPVQRLRQKGFEEGERFCEAKDIAFMNASFCPAVPFNDARSEWVIANHFDQNKIGVLKFRFNPKTKLYEWVELGPMVGDAKTRCWEASLLHTTNEWILACRSNGKVAWARSKDPLKTWSEPTFSAEPLVSAPLTCFTCADGVVRLFTGDKAASPQKYDRDPLYCWEMTTGVEITATNRRVIFDSVVAKLPIRAEVRSKVDFCELFPLQGKSQLIVFGVSTRGYNFPYGSTGIPVINQAEKDAAGIYYATMTWKTAPAAVYNLFKGGE